MIMETNRYPIDFEALEKGDIIPLEKLEQITQAKKGTETFAFGALQLAASIMKAKDDMNEPVTVKYNKGTLVVLEDLEASYYNDNVVTRGIRKIARGFKRMLSVDTKEFDTDQKDLHYRKLETNGKYLQAIKLIRKGKLILPAHNRATPGLPGNTE